MEGEHLRVVVIGEGARREIDGDGVAIVVARIDAGHVDSCATEPAPASASRHATRKPP